MIEADTPARAAFEAWAAEPQRAAKLPLERWPNNNGYRDFHTYAAWYGWKFASLHADKDRAQRQDAETWSLYIASMVEAYLQSQPAADKREAAIAGIISRRLWALPDRAQRQAEPGAKREQSALDARAASAARAEAFDAQRQAVPAIEFSDPQVQIAYAILADSNSTPPAGEHWEGFAARRIVSALRQAVQEPMFWYKPNPASVRDLSFYRTQTYTEPLYAAPQPVQVPLTHDDVRAAGGMVHGDGNIFFTNIEKLNAACGIHPA